MKNKMRNLQIFIAIIPLAIVCTIFDWIIVLIPIKYFITNTNFSLLYISQLEISTAIVWFLANTATLFTVKRGFA